MNSVEEQEIYNQKYIKCIADTEAHINNVRANAVAFVNNFNLKYGHEALSPFGQKIIYGLTEKANVHDASKLQEPELETFIQATEVLKGLTYGSKEYEKQIKVDMKDALNHHYVVNDHHPEHFTNGISDMNIINLLEMLCDWTAACRRHNDGNIMESLEINKTRFKYTDKFQALLARTIVNNFATTPKEKAMAREKGWMDNDFDLNRIVAYLCQTSGEPYTVYNLSIQKGDVEDSNDFSFYNSKVNSKDLAEMADLDDYTLTVIANTL